jgi:hypothetical protein
MTLLLNIYWFSFALGLGYLLIAAALGAFGMAGHGHAADHSGEGQDFDLTHGGLDSADHDFAQGEAQGFDSSAADFHAESGDFHAEAQGGHDHTDAQHNMGSASDAAGADFASYKLASPTSIAALLTGFGGGGLMAAASGLPAPLSLAAALGGSIVACALAWLVIGKWLMSLQSTSYAKQIDMLGLEAEVLTPLEQGATGEIAYVLDGTRFTAPARLAGGERIGRREKVRIARVKDNIVYVVPRERLGE